MAKDERTYICIDLKTFYASVECVDRGLDPLKDLLVVADPERGPSTICLAVSPAMKRLGIRNRCRVFDIPQHLKYVTAKPRMRYYMEVSAKIYGIYLKFVSPQDIHVYSIDECFIDATPYLRLYRTTPRGLAEKLRDTVLEKTGISATAGIGTNLFLAKVALDIAAKHADDGIGELDEERFKQEIWPHRPITDIWGIGPGIARRLAAYHIFDLMGVAALSQDILYREFGANAEYLIDHAHGREPCTIAEIQAYRPAATSMMNGQVLSRDYALDEAKTVLREMVDASVLELVERGAAASGISLYVGYGRGAAPCTSIPVSCIDPKQHSAADDTVLLERQPRVSGSGGAGTAWGRTDAAAGGEFFQGEHGARRVGRGAFGHAGAQRKLPGRTNSFKKIWHAFEELFDETVAANRAIRRVNIGFYDLVPEELAELDLFTDVVAEERERRLAAAVNSVKGRWGKNALLRGTSFKRGATGRERNEQVGGHHA